MTEKENAWRAMSCAGPEWIPCMRDAVEMLPVSAVRDKTDGETDWFGTRWMPEGIPAPGGKMFADFADWRKAIRFPDLNAIDWAGLAARDCGHADREHKFTMAVLFTTFFERLHAWAGFEETLMAPYEEPEELAALLGALTEFREDMLRRVLRWYAPDMVVCHDDYGTQRALFLSPEMWRQYFKEPLRRLVATTHEAGKLFCLHSCGKIDEIVGDLVEIGVDSWDSVQFCCDLETIYAKYGDRLSFTPTMDFPTLFHGTPEQAREQVRRTIALLGGRRCVIPKDAHPLIPAANRAAIDDEVRKYNREHGLYARREDR